MGRKLLFDANPTTKSVDWKTCKGAHKFRLQEGLHRVLADLVSIHFIMGAKIDQEYCSFRNTFEDHSV